MFHEVLYVFDMVGGMAYQWSNDTGQLLDNSACNYIPARHSGSGGCHVYEFQKDHRISGEQHQLGKVFYCYWVVEL